MTYKPEWGFESRNGELVLMHYNCWHENKCVLWLGFPVKTVKCLTCGKVPPPEIITQVLLLHGE